MGLTFEEAQRLGLAEEHPEHPSRRKETNALPRRNKFGAIRTEHNGVKYDSKAEAVHAEHLDYEMSAGLIRFWIGQAKFRLGVPENAYVVDFLVWNRDGTVEAHEVKGRRTPKFERDLKLWEAYAPCPLKIFHCGRLTEIIIPRSKNQK